MTSSVIVIVADRAEQLTQLFRGLERGARRPDEVVVVDMGSSDEPRSAIDGLATGLPVRWVELPQICGGRLPLAAARNEGAAHASGDRLIFCDVDCIPDHGMIGAYEAAIDRGGIVCGPVRYLERFWSAALAVTRSDIDLDLWARSALNPVRPVVTVETVDDRHELFWSLAFGLDRQTWQVVGGFDEAYVGYGAEDTDFAFTARALGIPLRWTPTGTVFHQWHPSSDPPVEHLGALVDNARRFRRRWGRWPMEGWLRGLQRRGLVVWDPASTELHEVATAPPPQPRRRVASIPASHPYTRRVVPQDVTVIADPTDPWWPHVALEPEWIERERPDLVHLHFGFEHRTPTELTDWCQVLRDLDIGLVVTVHDLLNPHTADNRRHEHHLSTLLDLADEVITLTPGAAAEIDRRWGRLPRIVPHPHVAPLDWRDRFPRRTGGLRSPQVGVNFSSLRANTLSPEPLLAGLATGVDEVGGSLAVRADAGSSRDDLRHLQSAADRVGVELTVAGRPGDGALVGALTQIDVAVLPYAFGTHSGMVELCHDVGTRVLVADTGFYREQWGDVETFALGDDRLPDPDLVAAAIRSALTRDRPEPADRSWREAQLRQVLADHASVYRQVLTRCRA